MQIFNDPFKASQLTADTKLPQQPYMPPTLTLLLDENGSIAGSNQTNERENTGGILMS